MIDSIHNKELKPYYDKIKKLGGTFFENVTSNPHAKQTLVKFPNNYGASIIKGYGTYGYEVGAFELCRIKIDEDGLWHLDDDPIGWLSPDNVYDYLVKISELKEDEE